MLSTGRNAASAAGGVVGQGYVPADSLSCS